MKISFVFKILQNSQENQKSKFSPNVGKYGLEITPYLDTFHPLYSAKQPHESTDKRSSRSKISIKNRKKLA